VLETEDPTCQEGDLIILEYDTKSSPLFNISNRARSKIVAWGSWVWRIVLWPVSNKIEIEFVKRDSG
jgi:hypothetical protein